MTRTVLETTGAQTRRSGVGGKGATRHIARATRTVFGLAAAVGLVIGTLGAVLLVAVPGTAGAATPTPVNTMYVLNQTTGAIQSFAPGSTGNVAPTSTVSGTATTLTTPFAMTTDAAGNVWVANEGAGTVVEFTKAQLAVGAGLPPPR